MNKSWLKIQCFIPFRSKYMYWDKKPYFGKYEFIKQQIKVHYKYKFKCFDYPYEGIIISCWTKDSKKIEKIMNNLNKKLKNIDNNYMEFLKLWYQNFLKFSKEKVS